MSRLRLVYERGHDLVPRLIGRAALFQAYTSVLAAPSFATGFLRAPPGLEQFNQSWLASASIAAWGVGFYLAVRRVNSRLVSKVSVEDDSQLVHIETISSSSRHDNVTKVPLKELSAAPFVPKSQQVLRMGNQTLLLDHRGNKFTDAMFFSRLGSKPIRK